MLGIPQRAPRDRAQRSPSSGSVDRPAYAVRLGAHSLATTSSIRRWCSRTPRAFYHAIFGGRPPPPTSRNKSLIIMPHHRYNCVRRSRHEPTQTTTPLRSRMWKRGETAKVRLLLERLPVEPSAPEEDRAIPSRRASPVALHDAVRQGLPHQRAWRKVHSLRVERAAPKNTASAVGVGAHRRDWRNVQPNNIDLLCPNCHSLTPTFKALNKGRGRELRQEKRNARRAVEEATRAGEAVDAVGRGESAVPPKRILRTPMTRAREAPVQPRFEFEERARR